MLNLKAGYSPLLLNFIFKLVPIYFWNALFFISRGFCGLSRFLNGNEHLFSFFGFFSFCRSSENMFTVVFAPVF